MKFGLLQHLLVFLVVAVPGSVNKAGLLLIGKHDHTTVEIDVYSHNAHHGVDEFIDI